MSLGPITRTCITHTIDAFFREGGAAPPIWARANGIDSVVLGMTFIDELLGIYVRIDDDADTICDLAGRRIALPVWPKLVFNFWKVVSLYAWHCALDAPQTAARCEYRLSLIHI